MDGCEVLEIARVYPKTLFVQMFYSWCNCPLKLSFLGTQLFKRRYSMRFVLFNSSFFILILLFLLPENDTHDKNWECALLCDQGDCTNEGKCCCYPGWEGEFCDNREYIAL